MNGTRTIYVCPECDQAFGYLETCWNPLHRAVDPHPVEVVAAADDLLASALRRLTVAEKQRDRYRRALLFIEELLSIGGDDFGRRTEAYDLAHEALKQHGMDVRGNPWCECGDRTIVDAEPKCPDCREPS